MSEFTSPELYDSKDVEKWKECLGEYADTMKQKAASSKKKDELLELDEWYQKELPGIISARDPKHITHEEITKLMKWKLMRGKFRPKLQQMVESNPPGEVRRCSTEGFKKIPDIGKAIEALTQLKAIGPATASAILAAGCPEHAPFMSDESVLAVPGLQPIKYTLKHYTQYAAKVQAARDRLNKLEKNNNWTAHQVELALWVSYVKPRLPSAAGASGDAAAKRGTKRKSDGDGK